jgi:hypothetical protein
MTNEDDVIGLFRKKPCGKALAGRFECGKESESQSGSDARKGPREAASSSKKSKLDQDHSLASMTGLADITRHRAGK